MTGCAGRRRAVVALFAVLCASVLAVATPTPTGATFGSATNGLRISSTTTFTVDGPTGVVKVEAAYQLTNTLSNRRSGGSIERPYFSEFAVPVVGSHFGVEAEQNGRPLDLTLDVDDNQPLYAFARVALARNLFAGDSTTVHVRYLIVGSPPRDPNIVRASPAFVGFPAFGMGDPGQATVHVVIPLGWRVDDVIDSDVRPDRAEAFGNVIYTLENVAEPDQTTIWVLASNPEQLAVSALVDADGNRFEIHRWPNDPEWLSFVSEQLRLVPTMSSLIGEPWPVPDTLGVYETITPELEGYAGTFSEADRSIEVGEMLDRPTMVHELMHAWFGRQWYTDRWLIEGLAETYASALLAAVGDTPVAPDPVSADDPGALALNEWSNSFTATDDEPTEAFGYNASYFVAQTIVGEIGLAKMREVFDAQHERRVLFPANGTFHAAQAAALPADGNGAHVPVDWRRFLDLVEIVGGSRRAASLFADRVVTDIQREELDARAGARRDYARAVEAAGTWTLPAAYRAAIEGWRWSVATAMNRAVQRVFALRDELVAGDTDPAVLDRFAKEFAELRPGGVDGFLAELRAAVAKAATPVGTAA